MATELPVYRRRLLNGAAGPTRIGKGALGGKATGLVRLRAGRGVVFGLRDGLIDDAIFGILEDPERVWNAKLAPPRSAGHAEAPRQ